LENKNMGRKWTPEQRKAASERAKAAIAAEKAIDSEPQKQPETPVTEQAVEQATDPGNIQNVDAR
jgi:predicted  nucleic acid-binding Zn-ribbon protein